MVFFESFVKPPPSPVKKHKHSSSSGKRRLSAESTSPTVGCDDSVSAIGGDPIHNTNNNDNRNDNVNDNKNKNNNNNNNNNGHGLTNLTLPFDDDSKSFIDVEKSSKSNNKQPKSPSKQQQRRSSVKKATSSRNFSSSSPQLTQQKSPPARSVSNNIVEGINRAPPSSPLRKIGRKLSWSNMEELTNSNVNAPKSPIRTIGRKLFWSNMEDDPSVDNMEDQIIIRRAAKQPQHRSPQTIRKSPNKKNNHIKKQHKSLSELKAPMLDFDNDNINDKKKKNKSDMEKQQQEKENTKIKKTSSLRNMGEAIGRTLRKSNSLKNVGSMVKKLSLRSLRANLKGNKNEEDASATDVAVVTGDCSLVDHTRSHNKFRRRSSHNTIRRVVSMRGMTGGGGSTSAAAVAKMPLEDINVAPRPHKQLSERSFSLSPRRRSSKLSLQKMNSTRTISSQQQDTTHGHHWNKDNNQCPGTPVGSNQRPGISTALNKRSSLTNNNKGNASTVPNQITANSPIRPRRQTIQKHSSSDYYGKQSSFVPSSPVRKATARKISSASSDFTNMKGAGTNTFHASFNGSNSISNNKFNGNASINSCMTVFQTTTMPSSPQRKKYTSVSECFNDYSQIVSIDDPSESNIGW